MTNKDALEALDTLSSIAHLNLHGSVETTQFDCIDTIRQALEVNQELAEALKDLICASKSSGYPHEALKRSEQALAKAEAAGEIS